jgi:hypothetical protein
MSGALPVLDWLAAPIDPGRAHEVGPLVSWHGRLMVLAWGVIAPLSVLVARHFKVLPWQDWPRELDNRTWWHVHRGGQAAILALSLAALALVLRSPAEVEADLHRRLGWAVLVLLGVQTLSGLLRGTKGGPGGPEGPVAGDHYDMTRRRRAFEAVHKTTGHALILLAAACIGLGLWAANAPLWMWVALGLWWAALLTVAAALERRGRRVPTYQAIWGPDPAHPGNRPEPMPIKGETRP